jgi:hypothetical protein
MGLLSQLLAYVAGSNRDHLGQLGNINLETMRALLLLAIAFICALMGWFVYSQPSSAGSDKTAGFVERSRSNQSDRRSYQFDAVAEEKREEAALAECDKRAATKRLTYDDRLAFIESCLQAFDTAHPARQQ